MVAKTRDAATFPVTFMLSEDVLEILHKRADAFGQSLDAAVSDLIRESEVEGNVPNRRVVNGILLLNHGDREPVTLDLVNELRDECE